MLAAILATTAALTLAALGILGARWLKKRLDEIAAGVKAMCDSIGDIPDPDEFDPAPQAVIDADRSGFFAPPPGSTQ